MMIRGTRQPSCSTSSSLRPKSSSLITTPTYMKASPIPSDSQKEEAEVRKNGGLYTRNKKGRSLPVDDDDPLCNLNLKETSEFVKALPLPITTSTSTSTSSSEKKRLEAAAPSTPGRPTVFSFTTLGNLSTTRIRKGFPSKWDDAQKWLINCNNDSPSATTHAPHVPHPITLPRGPPSSSSSSSSSNSSSRIVSKQIGIFQQKGGEAVSSFHPPMDQSTSPFTSAHVLLQDKFTDDSEPTKDKFVFRSSTMKDVGTEMTPLPSSTTSTCHTPFKPSSPPRHNTPADISGPLTNGNTLNISHLQQSHFANLHLHLGPSTQFDSPVSNWTSRQEEEEEISKSLRHLDTCTRPPPRNITAESRASAWEQEDKTKSCIRYQREAARIQAWVSLQSAKAQAQSRKMEVKIEKMRSSVEEKVLKRMATVNRKAEEMRAAAQLEHQQQIQRVTEQAERLRNQHHYSPYYTSSCGCLPCNNHHF